MKFDVSVVFVEQRWGRNVSFVYVVRQISFVLLLCQFVGDLDMPHFPVSRHAHATYRSSTATGFMRVDTAGSESIDRKKRNASIGVVETHDAIRTVACHLRVRTP